MKNTFKISIKQIEGNYNTSIIFNDTLILSSFGSN